MAHNTDKQTTDTQTHRQTEQTEFTQPTEHDYALCDYYYCLYLHAVVSHCISIQLFGYTQPLLLNTRKPCYRKDDRAMRAIQVDREPLRRYGHSKLSKIAAAAILNLFESKIAPSDPPSPKTQT